MDTVIITLQDAANLVTFIVPGYFALRVYAAVYAKPEQSTARLVIESLVCSLPLVALTNWLWSVFTHRTPSVVSVNYVAVLLLLSVAVGGLFAFLRRHKPISNMARKFGFDTPDQDFIRAQFHRLHKNESVAVTLKNGEIFSGRPQGSSFYRDGAPREYFFDEAAWYDQKTGSWNVRSGGVIINLDEVEYIEMP